jgi:hypothetical protein
VPLVYNVIHDEAAKTVSVRDAYRGHVAKCPKISYNTDTETLIKVTRIYFYVRKTLTTGTLILDEDIFAAH